MGTLPGNPVDARPREWLAMPGGRIRQVVSVPAEASPAEASPAELVSPAVWLARLAPTCSCGRPCLGSGRTCGAAACIRRLREQEPGS